MSEVRSTSERQPLIGYVGCSFLLHLGIMGMAALSPFGAMLASSMLPGCHEPIIHDAMEVSVVSLPKRLNVPDRPAKVKVASGEKTPIPEPPPIKESDLKIHQDKPDPKNTGNEEEARRQEIIEDAKRRQLLEQLQDAPDGPKDRNPTDPNGTAKDMENAVLGAQAQGDPEFARWVKQVGDLVKANFHPLSAGDIHCELTVTMNVNSGAVESVDVAKGSGVLAFDSAAERAVQDTPRLPPPPAKYRPLVESEGFRIKFDPQ